MLNTILILFRTIFLILSGYEQVAVENLALQEQLGIFQRSIHRLKIRQRDRLFWVCLLNVWQQWRSRLVIVRPGFHPTLDHLAALHQEDHFFHDRA